MKPRKHMMEEMGAAYTANGLITLAGRGCTPPWPTPTR